METENYGTLIKNLRIQNGLTQNQVAEALGVTPGYISNVENNRTAMSLRILTYYAIIKLDMKTKEKLLKTIELWKK